MNTPIVGMPDLSAAYRLLPCRSHPCLDEVESALRRWVREVGLVESEALVERVDRCRLGEMTAWMFPMADDPLPIAKYLTWVTVADDILDDGQLRGQDMDAETTVEVVRAAMSSGQPPGSWPDHRMTNALGDLWPEFTGAMSPAWQRRFRRHVVNLVDFGARWSRYQNDGTRLDVALYVRESRTDGVYESSLDMIEFATGLCVPDEVCRGTEFHRLWTAVMDVIVWTNDLVSADKDLRDDDMASLVVMLHGETGSWPQAVERAAGMVERRVRDLLDAELRYQADDTGWPGTGQWIETAKYMLHGLQQWNIVTPRYL